MERGQGTAGAGREWGGSRSGGSSSCCWEVGRVSELWEIFGSVG